MVVDLYQSSVVREQATKKKKQNNNLKCLRSVPQRRKVSSSKAWFYVDPRSFAPCGQHIGLTSTPGHPGADRAEPIASKPERVAHGPSFLSFSFPLFFFRFQRRYEQPWRNVDMVKWLRSRML